MQLTESFQSMFVLAVVDCSVFLCMFLLIFFSVFAFEKKTKLRLRVSKGMSRTKKEKI